MLVSDVQHSDSVIYVYILFYRFFPYGLLQNIEYNSLCQYSTSLLVICFMYSSVYMLIPGFQGGSVLKHLSANAGDLGLIPRSGRSPAVGNDNPVQYSCLNNSKDWGAWRVTVCGVARVTHNLSSKQWQQYYINPKLLIYPSPSVSPLWEP